MLGKTLEQIVLERIDEAMNYMDKDYKLEEIENLLIAYYKLKGDNKND